MFKRIDSAYEYLDYRLILNDDFFQRTLNNHNYSMRAYSRDLDLSVSFVADLLKGRKDLSPEKSKEIFSKLGFTENELHYIEDLVLYRTSKNEELKSLALERISIKFKRSELKNPESKDLLLKSAEHFIVYGILSITSSLDSILKITNNLGIKNVDQILEEFVMHGYVNFDGNNYHPTEININFNNHDNIIKCLSEFSMILCQKLMKSNKYDVPNEMGHYFVFNLDENTFPLFVEGYRKLIASISKFESQSKREKIIFFNSCYTSIDLTEEKKQYSFPNIPIY